MEARSRIKSSSNEWRQPAEPLLPNSSASWRVSTALLDRRRDDDVVRDRLEA